MGRQHYVRYREAAQGGTTGCDERGCGQYVGGARSYYGADGGHYEYAGDYKHNCRVCNAEENAGESDVSSAGVRGGTGGDVHEPT